MDQFHCQRSFGNDDWLQKCGNTQTLLIKLPP